METGLTVEREDAPPVLDPALRDRVCRFALRLTGDHHLAEDVAQETVARVLREGVPRDLPYLFRIALNLVRTEARGRARRRLDRGARVDRVADRRTPGPLETLETKEEKERFWKALGHLPERERSALVLRHGEGLTCAEIALVFGTTSNAVSCLLRRGKDRLLAIHAPGREP